MSNKAKSVLSMVISLIIAVVTWVYVVYTVSPTKDVKYSGVPITFEGEDKLAYAGMAVEKSSAESVDVVLNIKRTEMANIDADDISIIADVSAATKGNNTINLQIVPPEGSSLVKKSIGTVTVEVGDCSSANIEMTAVYTVVDGIGEPAFNNISTSSVVAYGSKDNIEQVKYAAITFKNGELNTSPMNFDAAPVAYGENAEVIPHIVFYPSSVKVDAYAGTLKIVKVKYNIVDNSHAEKDVDGPAEITIKGTAASLENINYVETEEIDLSNVTEESEILLRFKLPSGVNISQSSLGEVLKVKIA
ncbi:MAG: CdaR family protein [Mogibacterium sp.]|nr:CdaR family protein [Mogibacterium sp.]